MTGPDGVEVRPNAPDLTMDEAERAAASLPDGLLVVQRGGRTVSVNARAADVLRRRPEDLVGRLVLDVLDLRTAEGTSYWSSPDPWSVVRSVTGHRERLLVLGTTQVLVTARYVRRPGETEVATVLLGLRDAHERLRVERERAFLLAATAHELRTPLASVRGFSGHLVQHWDELGEDERIALLRTIEAEADHVSRLVEDLLHASASGAAALPARPRDVPLSAILPCHRDSLRTRARLGAHDVVLADPGDLAVRADPDRLNQILTNVLSNAVRHGAPPIHVTAWADGDEVVIEVRDHGPGITPEHARLAFVRQWRAGPYAGAGIGLHLTQALVAAHGGSVEFVPVDGPGAAVQVRLPRC